MTKEICVTTDFFDDLLHHNFVYTHNEIDQMMKLAASLGATRYEWILDTIWALYEDYPGGFDLLSYAADAAHREGMRFDVIFKPFEGGIGADPQSLPHTLPVPDDSLVRREICGLVHAVRPFVCSHPEMRLQRQPDCADTAGPISRIRLIKNDEQPTGIQPEDLSIWTSEVNGGYELYTGPMRWDESVERRPVFPYGDRLCRVLSLSGLEISDNQRYILVRCDNKREDGDFTNEIEKLIELEDSHGRTIETTPALRPADLERIYERARAMSRLGLSRYLNHPDSRELLDDRDEFLDRASGMQVFVGRGGSRWPTRTLDRDGCAAVARGRPEYQTGALHPIYPEVRENWLDHIRYCIERDVDGVNIRLANHHRPPDRWEFGFNEPVLEKVENPHNRAEVARVNGTAYTGFLREAARLLHGEGRELGVHVHGRMFFYDDRGGPGPLQRNFDWQWQTWIMELADYVEFRGSTMLRPHNRREAVDRIALAAREADIPLIYQSRRPAIHFDGPHHCLSEEMDWVWQHPGIDIYNLYETANFTDVKGPGEQMELSPGLQSVLENFPRQPEAHIS